MNIINFFYLFPFFSILTFINTVASHNRRTLHQPFFPPDSPAVPPSSQSNLPFTPNPTTTTTTTASPPADRPFFQNLPSPPAFFPANIPSINLPKSKRVSSKLIVTVVTLVIAAGIVVAIVVYLRIQNRRTYDHDSASFNDQKSNRTDSGSRVVVSYNVNNGTGSDNMTPKLSRPSQSSAEFSYLGTLVNPHGDPDNHRESSLRKMDSPELRPLPPLNSVGNGVRSGGNFRNNSIENVEVESSKDEELEIFYSPGGSDARSEPVVRVDNYVSEKLNGWDSSPCSGYLARSMSLSVSPPGSLRSPNLPPLALVIRSPDIRLSNMESSPGLADSSSDQNSPPKVGIPPPPKSSKTPTPPPVFITPAASGIKLSPENQENVENPKPRLKPLHWDKVRASSDRETVWDHLKLSSFKLNEEMIESLFVVKTPKSNVTSATIPIPPWSHVSQESRVLDPKKAQNIAISLRALNVTIEQVCDALLEGNADTLGAELLESLMKMAPTKEEEWKLKEYQDDSPVKLGPAEKFLKAVLDVPFVFKRVDAMLYMSNFESEVEYLTRSFQTLQLACEELRNSRMFLKLLEAVLKTGNRMNVGTNRGDAQAFKLDTLLKLIDVKGTDGKTTLLHFVVQEIIKSEGARLSTKDTTPPSDTKCRKLGLQLVTKISSELTNVKKAAAIDAEVLNSDVTKLSKGISDISQVVRLNDTIPDRKRFSESMNMFMQTAEEGIIRIQTQESVVFSLVKEVTEYFHGNSAKEEAHPFRIFTVVRDFLNVLDRVCKEVGSINDHIVIGSGHRFPVPVNPTLPAVFSGLPENR